MVPYVNIDSILEETKATFYSCKSKVSIPLYYFPSNVHCTIKGETKLYSYHIRDHHLEVESNDVIKNHICTIILSCKEERRSLV